MLILPFKAENRLLERLALSPSIYGESYRFSYIIKPKVLYHPIVQKLQIFHLKNTDQIYDLCFL